MASDRTDDTSVSRLLPELASPTDPAAAPRDDDEIEYHPMDSVEGVEDVELYNRGGLHPVHLGDTLDGRFEVVHKLGHGGFSTVWLCQDVKQRRRWRAVKIMTADHSARGNDVRIIEHLTTQSSAAPAAAPASSCESNHVSVPLERFWLEGPNGRHLCLVSEVLGWDVATWSQHLHPLAAETPGLVNDACRQIAKGLRFLHSRGVCHGDVRPPNILMRLRGLDRLSKRQVLALTGAPELVRVRTTSGASPQPRRAPTHCVVDVDPRWCETLSSSCVAIVDFGESFRVEAPPETTAIPSAYGAPEILVEGVRTPGFPSDVWSLACTMYEVKTHDMLFGSRWGSGGGVNMAMGQMARYLGPVPEPYEAAYRRQLHAAFKRPLDEDEDEEAKKKTSTSSAEEEAQPAPLPTEAECAHPFEKGIGAERQYLREDDGLLPEKQEETIIKYRYPQRDIALFPDLLGKMLKYDPAERISIHEVLSHPWMGGLPAYLALYGRLRSIPLFVYIWGIWLLLLLCALLCWASSRPKESVLMPVTAIISERHVQDCGQPDLPVRPQSS
ncbi:kinase-like domain-containing protein [Biscogniauxia mediterranea]|nr:kinase-like domain-containing protein [Biscogniauxia mediterranea]